MQECAGSQKIARAVVIEDLADEWTASQHEEDYRRRQWGHPLGCHRKVKVTTYFARLESRRYLMENTAIADVSNNIPGRLRRN